MHHTKGRSPHCGTLHCSGTNPLLAFILGYVWSDSSSWDRHLDQPVPLPGDGQQDATRCRNYIGNFLNRADTPMATGCQMLIDAAEDRAAVFAKWHGPSDKPMAGISTPIQKRPPNRTGGRSKKAAFNEMRLGSPSYDTGQPKSLTG